MNESADRLKAALADRYIIQRELGAGGMATVFLAQDVRHNRDVAVKVLRTELASELGPERFVREIQLAASLTHPHILPLFDSGEKDGFLYFVMPVMEGESLRDRIQKERQLSVETAMQIACEVADALDYAHRHSVVHRDIKPENIMLHDGHALVTDFGIGKAVAESADADTITHAGITVGTPAYMSPEQASGEGSIDGRSDLYSLGCVLYEVLTGEQPFTGPTAQAVIAKRFTHTPPNVTRTRENVPSHIGQAVARLLEKTPADRFATGSQVVEALKAGHAGRLAKDGDHKSIAVLPFANMSADPENEYFADGITEEIINALTQLKDLRVAGRTSSFVFKGKSQDLRVIGEELNVRTVLEGSVRRAGPRVRITAQLVDVSTGYHLWSERYDRKMDDIFAVQDEIATAIAHRLKIALRTDQTGPLVKKSTDHLEAYELYLKGRALLYERGVSIRQGLSCFSRALELDPGYALAMAGMADAHVLMDYYGVAGYDRDIEMTKDAASRALEQQPELAEAQNAVALVSCVYERDWDAAERAFKRALELNPGYVQARCWYAWFYLLMVRGAADEAIANARRSVEIDPLAAYPKSLLAAILAAVGQYDEALRLTQEAIAREPNSFIGFFVQQQVCLWKGDFEEAIALADHALAISGRNTWCLSQLAVAYVRAGKEDDARGVYEEFDARAKREPIPGVHHAIACAAVGDMDRALDLLERSAEAREACNIMLARWPDMEMFRGQPRYDALLQQMGFK